jgi:hypothetical protein
MKNKIQNIILKIEKIFIENIFIRFFCEFLISLFFLLVIYDLVIIMYSGTVRDFCDYSVSKGNYTDTYSCMEDYIKASSNAFEKEAHND